MGRWIGTIFFLFQDPAIFPSRALNSLSFFINLHIFFSIPHIFYSFFCGWFGFAFCLEFGFFFPFSHIGFSKIGSPNFGISTAELEMFIKNLAPLYKCG